MSRTRQPLTVEHEPFLAVRSFACNYGGGSLVDAHRHSWHQLLYATSGAMSVRDPRYCWLIPPGKAVVIPAGCEHSILMWGTVAMRSLLLAPAVVDFGAECRVIAVTPLLRELALRVVECGALDIRAPEDMRLLGVLLDEIASAPLALLALPLPCDKRARGVAHHILDHAAAAGPPGELGRQYGASRRTLERLFRAETGLSLGLWRQKARLLDGARLLSEGHSVTDAALDCGYSSVSAFIGAFKRTFGCTPGHLWAVSGRSK
jgi:AraC-like DNA-binding protein